MRLALLLDFIANIVGASLAYNMSYYSDNNCTTKTGVEAWWSHEATSSEPHCWSTSSSLYDPSWNVSRFYSFSCGGVSSPGSILMTLLPSASCGGKSSRGAGRGFDSAPMFSRPFVESSSHVPAMMGSGCVPVPVSWSFPSKHKYFKFDEAVLSTDMPTCSFAFNYSVFSDPSCTHTPQSRPSHAIAAVPSERADCWSTGAGTYFNYCNMSDGGLPWMTAVSDCYAPVASETRYPWVETRADASRLLNGTCVLVPTSWGWPADWRYYKFHEPIDTSVMPVCSDDLDSFTETHWDGPTCDAPDTQIYVQTWYRLSNTCWLNSQSQYFEFYCVGDALMYKMVGPGCIADTLYQSARAGSWDGAERDGTCLKDPLSQSLPSHSPRWYKWNKPLTGQDLLWCTTTTTTSTMTNTTTITNTTLTSSTTSRTSTYTTQTTTTTNSTSTTTRSSTKTTTTMTSSTMTSTTTATTQTVEAITILGSLIMSVQSPAAFVDNFTANAGVANAIAGIVGVDAIQVRVVLSIETRRLQGRQLALGEVAADYYITVQKTTVAETQNFAQTVIDRMIAISASDLSIQINQEILATHPSEDYAIIVFYKSVPTIGETARNDPIETERPKEQSAATGKDAIFSFLACIGLQLAITQSM